jgi:sugar lactone lactonase YvrE
MRTWQRRLLIGAALAIPFSACTGYLLFWPTGLDPEEWDPADAPDWEANHKLVSASILHPELDGPEAVVIDAKGRVVTGLADGRIVRFEPTFGSPVETVAKTGGRPLGVAYDAGGRLFVADATRGLLAVTDGGGVEVLSAEQGGRRFRFTDDLAIAGDGTVYFTDASDRFSMGEFEMEIVEHRARGRVLAYDPAAKATSLVADKLYFANGIALGPGEEYLLVAETASYRIRKVWLGGERRGQVETLVDNLPGFPDNIRWSPARKVFWVALGAPRNGTLDWLASHPFLRNAVVRLPSFLQPAPDQHSFVLGYDEKGKLVYDLQGSGESAYVPIASAMEHDGVLYLGSFSGNGVARIAAPQVGQKSQPGDVSGAESVE